MLKITVGHRNRGVITLQSLLSCLKMSNEISKNKCSHLNSKHFHMDILSNTSIQFKSNASFSPQIVRLQMCFLSVDDTSTICPSSKHGKFSLSSVLCPTSSLPQIWATPSSSLHPGIPPFHLPTVRTISNPHGPIPQ